MQPIALDLELVRSVINGWGDYKVQREFHKMIENLERYHSVPVDQVDGKSSWLEGFKEIISRITDQNLQKMITDLLGPRNIKYFPAKLNDNSKLLESLSDSTPDKIGLEIRNHTEDPIKYYDLTRFNSNEPKSDCRLLRLPKTIKIEAGEQINIKNIFAPFIRSAKKLEFCDKFLFKYIKNHDDSILLFQLMGLSDNLEKVNVRYLEDPVKAFNQNFDSKARKIYGKSFTVSLSHYRRSGNHDRFIIVDDNKISIRLSASFNNLRQVSDSVFKSEVNFSIEFMKGRLYSD